MTHPQHMKQAFECNIYNQHLTFFCNHQGVWIIMVLGTFLFFSLVDISKEISATRNNFAFYKENCQKFNSDKFLGY